LAAPSSICSAVLPNDFYFPYQWDLDNRGQTGGQPGADINAPEAWCITTGSDAVVVAVLDTGIELDHPDLKDKLWVNPGEIANNGVDDDGNGYPDDVYGFNFAYIGHPPPTDSDGRGTFFAGIAAASGNNGGTGVAGLSWGARIMAVKILRDDRTGNTEFLLQGIVYAADNGAKVILLNRGFNCTNWPPEALQTLHDAVRYAASKGALVVVKVGDWAQDNNPVMCPAFFTLSEPNVIAVTASDDRDQRLPGAEYGSYVSVAAPSGSEPMESRRRCTTSTWIGGSYAEACDPATDIAAAHVAGVAALVWSVNPRLQPQEVRWIIESTAAKVGEYPYTDDGAGRTRNDYYGYGRVDAYAAVMATSHYLQVDPPQLVFLADNQTQPAAQRVVNRYTGFSTWRATPGAPWLSISGPAANAPSYIPPSYITVSANRGAVGGYGVYTATITVTSTLSSTMNNVVTIPVTFVYVATLPRVYLPLALR
jgi:subtilisin family serine protease